MSGAIYCDLKNLAKTIEKELKKDVKQVKYAAMKTLNNVAFEARENLMGEYSKSFTVRNKNLPKAVTVKKATKENLEAEVSFPKDWMLLNTIGGEKRPENSKSLAFAGSEIDKGSRLSSGKIKQSQKPARLLKFADNHPNRTKGGKNGLKRPHAFKTIGKNGYPVIGIRESSGSRETKWLYSLQTKAKIEKKWDFEKIVNDTAEKEIEKEFDKQLVYALETAK